MSKRCRDHFLSKRCPERYQVVIIKGYTDSIGSKDYNQKLSIDRATVIRDYLTYSEGLKDVNINIVGYGSLWPIAPNYSEDDRKRNRRVEIDILDRPMK